MEDFKDKVVVITGGGSGIGAATAKLFAKEKAKLAIVEINPQNGQAIAADLKALGAEFEIFKADVSNYKQVESVFQQVIERFGAVDVLVNNAGIGNKNPAKTADHTLEDWDNVIAVNQHGVFYCMKVVLHQMLKQGSGNIVNVASLAGLKASGRNLAYTASKFAVVGMTKSTALEYASKNIRVNCVCPGYTRTALFDTLLDADVDLHDKLLKYIPMRRYGQAEEIAEAIVWLASEKTSFVTGQAITLDGGLSL
ncbi:glucose 1-dehydrogenase [Chitinophagales bacterium]|nr:glucose 1-dehydrogenase [Chitinophagales bacterium]